MPELLTFAAPRAPADVPDDPTHDLVVAVAERFAALAAGPSAAVLEGATQALRQTSGPETVVLERLARGFALSPFERDLLVLAGLPEEHEAFADLARACHVHGEPRVSVATAVRVLDLDAPGRCHLRRALGTGPLARSGLVATGGPVPPPEQTLVLADGLWDVIRGGGRWPLGLHPLPDPATAPLGSFPTDDLLVALADEPRVVVVQAGPGRSAEDVAAHVRAALTRARRRAVLLRPVDVQGGQVDPLGCHLVGRDAVPVVVGACEQPPLPHFPGPVVLCLGPGDDAALDDRPSVELHADRLSLGEELSMWQTLAPELDDPSRLVGLLRVDGPRAGRVMADARLGARSRDRRLEADDVVLRARRRSDARLPASVRRSTPTTSWERLVTTPANEALLQSLVDRVRGQVVVLHDWGFAAVGGTRGARTLLAGPPGTGKTLSAHVVAADLGLDLLTVDLSALVSKWLGETEKNIGGVFDAAERCQAVLFFDEADSIFGRRTDSGDAQARWANLETAYLLSRMDAFDGLVVLATNLRGNIDEAFTRRLDIVVEYDEPGPDERLRLWRAHLPPEAPLAPDVDLLRLAWLYPVTGGTVRNAVLSAAFRAAGHGGRITQPMLVDGVRREYQKSGRTFPGAPRDRTASPGDA